MPPRSKAPSLFHPKKRDVKKELNDTKSPSPRGVSSTPHPKPKVETLEDDSAIPQPDGPYQEFKLMSSSRAGWKYDVMRLDTRKPVDIAAWHLPVKLNRKDITKQEQQEEEQPEAVAQMLGPDGKPVVGADGNIVMVDAGGRPIHPMNGASGSSTPRSKEKDKDKAAGNKKMFQKKTRQVFLVPEETRKMKREERFPWVLEDGVKEEVWIGRLDDVGKSDNRAMFMPAEDNSFKFIPIHRWYKFQKVLPHWFKQTLEETESRMALLAKSKDPAKFFELRNGRGPSAATSAMFKAEAEGRTLITGGGLMHTSGQSVAPGGRRLKAVDSGMRGLFDEDDEEGLDTKRKKEKEYGGDGDLDEIEYEQDFADDEENMEPEGMDDEEAKELEERIKREYKQANKKHTGVDESDDEEGGEQLTGAGKATKKLLRNHEKNGAYDSDEEKNPYASSDEQEEEEEVIPVPPTVEPPPEPQQPELLRSQTPIPGKAGSPAVASTQPVASTPNSRATSPAPSLGGHSVVAKRATSPKPPKAKSAIASRATSPSPLAQRASLSGSRATSPIAQGSTNSTASPHSVPKPNANKRKAADDLSGAPSPGLGGAPKAKKRKAQPGASGPPPGELEDKMVIDWLRMTPNASTRDCIAHFTPYLTDEMKKTRFTGLVKEVAQLRGGVLVLRNAYREGGGSAAASPVLNAVEVK